MNDHCGSTLFELVTDGDLLVLIDRMLHLGGHDTVRSGKVKGQADDGRFLMVGFVSLTSLVMMLLMRLPTLVVGGSDLLSLMLIVIFLECVVGGILLFLIFFGSLSPFLGLWSIMTVGMVMLLILWSGLLVHYQRGEDWFMLYVALPCCLGRLLFGLVIGFVVQLLL